MLRRTTLGRRAGLLSLALLALILTVTPVAEAAMKRLDATVRRTEYGVAHVKAKTFEEVGFGFATRSPRTTSAPWRRAT